MPRRTLGLETLRVRPGRNRRKLFSPLTNVEGDDLLALFYGLFINIDMNLLRDEQRGRYIRIESVKPSGRSVLITANAGWYGEDGQTINVRTHATSHDRGAEDAAAVKTRISFTVPPGGEIGLFGVERQGNEGAGPRLIDLFRRSLMAKHADYSFDTETVVEASAWNASADLIEVTAVAYNFSPDIADAPTAQPRPVGRLQHTLVPEKGERGLPRWLWEKLRKREVQASDFLGFREGTSVDETTVRVKGQDGREKTFALDRERVPAVRIALTENGVPALTDNEFLRVAQNEAKDYYLGMGLTWDELWKAGQWSTDALETRLAPHNPGAA